jgi:opacity protein-like surface antigen
MWMNKLFLTLIGMAAFAFAGGAQAADLPVKAAPQTSTPAASGYFGFYVGPSWLGQVEDDVMQRETNFVYGGEARANLWINPRISLQFDAEGEGTVGFNRCCTTPNRSSGALGAHLATRDPNSYALGVFGAGIWGSNLDTGSFSSFIFGGEGQAYFANSTLYGQAGYLGTSRHNENADNLWFVRGMGRYFFTPNDRLSAEIGFARGDITDWTDNRIDIWNWGVSYERRFAQTPYSMYLDYAGNHLVSTQTPSDRSYEHIFTIGGRVYFNEATLLANDRTGATFNLPKFIRALPWVSEAD